MKHRLLFLGACASAIAFAIACGSSDGGGSGDDPGTGGDGGGSGDGSTTGSSGGNGDDDSGGSTGGKDAGGGAVARAAPGPPCPRTPAETNRERKVIVSHPFAKNGSKAKVFEVLDLSTNGTISKPATPVTFQMGTALDSPIVFTPDGEIGLVAQDDGSIGIFRVTAGQAPVVIEAAYKQGFYGHDVVLAPDGSRFWVLDRDTASNDGGVYEVTLDCQGRPNALGMAVPGGGATAMALVPNAGSVAVLAAQKAYGSPAGTDLFLVDLDQKKLLASASTFAADPDGGSPIVSRVAISPDQKYALVADDGLFAGNRVGAVAIGATSLTPKQVIDTPYPASVVFSPFGNAAAVLNDDATDEIHIFDYAAANTTTPFTVRGELDYKFGKPQIPVTASLIEHGNLEGTFFVGENVAVRQIQFKSDGTVLDVAKFDDFSADLDGIVGVVGVQP